MSLLLAATKTLDRMHQEAEDSAEKMIAERLKYKMRYLHYNSNDSKIPCPFYFSFKFWVFLDEIQRQHNTRKYAQNVYRKNFKSISFMEQYNKIKPTNFCCFCSLLTCPKQSHSGTEIDN